MIRSISSAANPLVKLARALDRKKARTETGLFVAEGARHVTEGLDRGWRLHAVLAAESAVDRPQVRALLTRADATGAEAVTLPDHLLETLTHRDNAQSVIGLFRQQLGDLEAFDTSRPLIALEAPRDPGNLGTIIRTADSTGCAGVVLLGVSCDPFSMESVRASMGSVFAMPVVRAEAAGFFDWADAHGVRVFGTSLEGSQRHTDTDLTGPVAILMGTEQSGLTADSAARCSGLIRLPMAGGADSLNLGIATAVTVYEVWRQRGFDGARF
ncbi:MAG: RNA methyltransferase [Hyphomonadaceae bacterium]|jgi:TrmH family RNA methyltransferase|nr:RNA methyltransferase [Hyphomonadaceae bacterium]